MGWVLALAPAEVDAAVAEVGAEAEEVFGLEAERPDVGHRVHRADVVDGGHDRSTSSPRPTSTALTIPEGNSPLSTTPGITESLAASSPGSLTLPWKSAITRRPG